MTARPPWDFPSLPDGITSRDFEDAAASLATGTHSGRVQSLPTGLPQRTSRLLGTHYPNNALRISAAMTYPPLARVSGRHTLDRAVPLPGILWPDPSPMEGGRPVAVILPNGYAGSIWNKTGTILAQWVDSHAKAHWLWATVVYLGSDELDTTAVEVRHPTCSSMVGTLRA
jgi:hypothetical protein